MYDAARRDRWNRRTIDEDGLSIRETMAKPTDVLPRELPQEARPKTIAERRAERDEAANALKARNTAAERLAEALAADIQQEYGSYASINRNGNELSVERSIPNDDCIFFTVEDADHYLVGYQDQVGREKLGRDEMLDRLDQFLSDDE